MDAPVLSFAAWLRRARRSRDWTQEELAGRIGCAPITLRKLESGERRPSKELAARTAEIFDLPEADRARFMAFARALSAADSAGAAVPLSAITAPLPCASGAPPARLHNLPIQLTSFIGREREIERLVALLGRTRLLTLTGAGGCGKTRLALEVAARLAEDCRHALPNGVWLVDLARLADPDLIPQAIAAGLGIRDEALRPMLDQLMDYCASRRLLLVLDNCEHLVFACAVVADRLLRAAPGLQVLATSREPLAIGGELVFYVPSMQAPDPGRLPPYADAVAFEAIRLFQERAASVRPGFEVTPRNLPVVAEICERLDGMPLAIELAASRVRALPVEDICARLADRFHLLTGGSRAALPRHQTLAATIEWSYDLLSEPEAALLRRLAVFAGGWTLPAAEAVCAGVESVSGNVVELLTHLVDKSLVVPEWRGYIGRYGMLETLRQFGLERLEQAGEGCEARASHAAYFVALAEAVEPKLMSAEQRAWQISLEAEHNNIQIALDWLASEEAGRAADRPRELALRLAGALWRYWEVRGCLAEGQARLEPLLHGLPTGINPAILARAYLGVGVCSFYRGDFPAASAHYEESARLYRSVGDRYALTRPLTYLGWMNTYRTDFARARGELEEALGISRDLGDRQAEAWAMARLGIVAYWAGDPEKAIPLLEQALAISREMGDELGTGWWLLMLGQATYFAGRVERAEELGEECLACTQALGDRHDYGCALQLLAVIYFMRGAVSRGEALLRESLRIHQEQGDRFCVAIDLFCYPFALVASDPLSAVQIGAAAMALCDAGGFALPLRSVVMFEELMAQLKSAVGPDVFAAQWERGTRLPMEAATTLALGAGPAVAGG